MESALLDLKAELLKKKERAHAEAKQKKDSNFRTKLLLDKIKPIKSSKDEPYEEENILQKSKSILEKKAELYDKIQNGVEALENDELNEKFLVNFQKKIEANVSANKLERESKKNDVNDEDNNWVEYVDCFGRTRKCSKEEYVNMTEKELVQEQRAREASALEQSRHKMQEKWDKIDEESKNKSSLHYQDVLYNEARNHGVGFMPFSRVESERAEQMSMLKRLEEESLKAKAASKADKKSKDKKMAERLAKIRRRKRLKLGLPVKDIHEDKKFDSSSEEEELQVSEIPLPPENVPVASTSTKIREWDVGKTTNDGVILTQEQWLESQRKNRKEDFAPPQFYQVSKKNSFKKHKNSNVNPDNERRDERNPTFAPPPSFECYGPSVRK